MSRDPLSSGAGWRRHPFGYPGDNPVLATDPTGLDACWKGFGWVCDAMEEQGKNEQAARGNGAEEVYARRADPQVGETLQSWIDRGPTVVSVSGIIATPVLFAIGRTVFYLRFAALVVSFVLAVALKVGSSVGRGTFRWRFSRLSLGQANRLIALTGPLVFTLMPTPVTVLSLSVLAVTILSLVIINVAILVSHFSADPEREDGHAL